MMNVPSLSCFIRLRTLCFLRGDYVVVDTPYNFEKGVKISIGGDRPAVPDGGASGRPYSYWVSGKAETSSSFSAWEILLENTSLQTNVATCDERGLPQIQLSRTVPYLSTCEPGRTPRKGVVRKMRGCYEVRDIVTSRQREVN
ncbi:unnamed protein product [Strongylus vulgaris]|uniref:Uncharacterized protein n=1 Tax=Strongylus vulgaris TaxID=40348 RepID=A0A3P7K8X3_STRVU|nr:unnamed protein product [Strongylus vulgaris]